MSSREQAPPEGGVVQQQPPAQPGAEQKEAEAAAKAKAAQDAVTALQQLDANDPNNAKALAEYIAVKEAETAALKDALDKEKSYAAGKIEEIVRLKTASNLPPFPDPQSAQQKRPGDPLHAAASGQQQLQQGALLKDPAAMNASASVAAVIAEGAMKAEDAIAKQGDAAAAAAAAPASTLVKSTSAESAPHAAAAAPAAIPSSVSSESGWDWFKNILKKNDAVAAPAAAAVSVGQPIAVPASEAAAAAKLAADQSRDTLGGARSGWTQNVVRWGVNKLMGFDEHEEGMEPQWSEVLCRELVTVPTLDPQPPPPTLEGEEPFEPLVLENSHYYPAGFHNTPLPCIIIRTPYDRSLMRHTAERICRHGYHVVVQDTRNSPNHTAARAKQQQAKIEARRTKDALDAEAKAVKDRYLASNHKSLLAQYAANASSTVQHPPAAAAAAAASLSVDVLAPSLPVNATVAASSAAGSSSSAPRVAEIDAFSTPVPMHTAAPQEFFPVVHEAADGLATLNWVAEQKWCDGSISFFGASYLGIAQYAVVDAKHPALKCIVPTVSSSRVYSVLYPSGTLNLDLAARWLFLMFNPDVTGASPKADELVQAPSFWRRSYARVISSRSIIPRALDHLPACEIDAIVATKSLPFFQEMIRSGHDQNLPFWQEKKVKLCDLVNCPPLLIVEGWFDLFLHEALRDYVEALALWKNFQADIAAGKHTAEEVAAMRPTVLTVKPALTVISCVHIDWKQLYKISLDESIKFFDKHLKKRNHHSLDRPDSRSVRLQMIHAAAANAERHQAHVAKRKKAERAAAVKAGPAAVAALEASDAAILAAQDNPEPLSPRSKARWRQSQIDAEWRSFSEFPPEKSQPMSFFLHCEQDGKGGEKRVLRTDSPAMREKQRVALKKQKWDANMKSIVDGLHSEAAAAAVVPVAVPVAAPVSASAPPPSQPSAPIAPSLPYSCYTYNPADPTPAVGGPAFDPQTSGPLDNRSMESRSDVLVFTSEPLTEPLTVIGFVKAVLYVRSNCACTDFVARLCDVFPLDEHSGKSQMLCDGLFKIMPADVAALTVEKGLEKPAANVRKSSAAAPNLVSIKITPAVSSSAAELLSVSVAPAAVDPAFALPFFPVCSPDLSTPLLRLELDLWATANTFQPGHRIRLQVCSAAHPRWLRSLGGPDPIWCGLDQAVLQHQTVYHDSNFPSALVLPVLRE